MTGLSPKASAAEGGLLPLRHPGGAVAVVPWSGPFKKMGTGLWRRPDKQSRPFFQAERCAAPFGLSATFSGALPLRLNVRAAHCAPGVDVAVVPRWSPFCVGTGLTGLVLWPALGLATATRVTTWCTTVTAAKPASRLRLCWRHR